MIDPPDREVAVFSAARFLPTGERAAYLDEACAGDVTLRRRVEELLQAGEEAGAFLNQPALGAHLAGERAGSPNPNQTLRITPALAEKAGDRIGRYKLLQQIGEGGCGVVYMAEQEEPVRRQVALKVIKLGMDTKSVIARFEAERQALALMDHPNIAKVLDAGATDTGRPYFVMELVRGIKITDYCDKGNLCTRERLKLFVQVCQAIQHAHQKGIIHRDIKPSNILVTLRDGVPVPKVIDFGIAKATTDQRLTDKTLFTAFEQFIGTPAYMSPEQAEMSELGIDTRSDIYSLGVLLYELLTGQTPFDAKELLQAGLDAMRRIIREQEPARPSTRLSTLLEGELTSVANHRQTDAPKLVHLLRGDLDWIVMKSLEKDRNRRYETASGFAADVQRHLSNEPVEARPASGVYRLQKAVRRHKGAFATAAAIMVVLLAGIIVSVSQAVRAARATAVALAEKRRATEQAAIATFVGESLQRLLTSASPDLAKGMNITETRMLDEYGENVDQKLAGQPASLAAVHATIGKAYVFLGQLEKGKTHLRRAMEIQRDLFGDRHENYADSLIEYSAVETLAGGTMEEYEANVRKALAIYHVRGVGGQPVISAFYTLEWIYSRQSKWDQVETVVNEALAEARKSPGVDSPDIASMLHGLVSAKIAQSQYAEAEKIAREAIAMHLRLQGSEYLEPGEGIYSLHTDYPTMSLAARAELETGNGYYSLGSALQAEHKLPEALAAQQHALAIMQKWLPPDHPDIAKAVNAIARIEAMTRGNLNDAEEEEQCFRNLQKIHAAIMAYRKDHNKMPNWLSDLVPVYLSDTNSLICPVQARTMIKPDLSGMEDPKVTSSYLYEFSALTNVFPDPYGLTAPGDTMMAWKEKQLARYGPIVPVIRCRLHLQQIGITFGGARMRSGAGRWEDEAEKDLRAGTKTDPIPH